MSKSPETEDTWTVIIIDNSHSWDESEDSYVTGFPSEELAVEYARRFNRSSIEELGKEHGSEKLEDLWHLHGECAVVKTKRGPNITFTEELPFFFANPATPKECNYRAIARKAKRLLEERHE